MEQSKRRYPSDAEIFVRIVRKTPENQDTQPISSANKARQKTQPIGVRRPEHTFLEVISITEDIGTISP